MAKKDNKIIRFGISLPERLLASFDEAIDQQGYTNRSEAIRDLIRNHLVEREWEEENRQAVGTITLIYDHATRELGSKLNRHQHEHVHQVISSLHVHLDHDHCLEVLVLRGQSGDIRALADRLIGMRGVLHGRLTMTTTGGDLA